MADRALGSRAGKSQTVRVEVPAHCEPLAAKMRSQPHYAQPFTGRAFPCGTLTTASGQRWGHRLPPPFGKGETEAQRTRSQASQCRELPALLALS